MKSLFAPGAVALAAAALAAVPESRMTRPEHPAFTTGAAKGGVFEYRLKRNGLEVLLVPNDVAPVATVGVIYRVGSRNEAVGYTGSTHMLEHMLFKGTPRHNKAAGTQIAAALSAMGAAFNATTSFDRTNYFETLPADKVDEALDIESDRMRNSFIADADRKAEMTVVRNELERGENNPARVLNQQTMAAAFREHPYHHPTIGWRSDVEGVPTARLKKFYDDFYHPDNATLVIVGAYDPRTILAGIEARFGKLPPRREFPAMYTVEPPQQGERRIVVKRPGKVGMICLLWRSVRALDDDFMPLNVLGNVLAEGVNSRLQKALVDGGKLVAVEAGPYENHDPSVFEASGTLAPGVEHAEAEKLIREEVRRIAEAGPAPAETEAARRQLHAAAVFERDSGFQVFSGLTRAVAVGDWRFYTDYLERVAKVTPEQVQAVAKKYLIDDALTVGWFVPQSGSGAAAPKPAPGTKLSAPLEMLVPDAGAPAGGAAAAPPAAAPAAGGTNYAQRVLRRATPEGAVFLALENRVNPMVTISGRLVAGPGVEPSNPVLPTLAAGMLMRGTLKRSKAQLGDDLEGRGITLSFSTDRANPGWIVISGRCLKEDWPALQTALAETLREPAFPEAELALAKKEFAAAYQQEADNTTRTAMSLALRKAYPAGHPFRPFLPEEKLKLLEGVTREQLLAFHKSRYGAQTLVLAAVGDFERQAAVESLAAAFKGWRAPSPGRLAPPPVAATDAARDAQELSKANADVVWVRYTGLAAADADALPLELANNILGGSTLSSRLGLEVRDKLGLTYGIGSRLADESLGGHWLMSVTVAPENREQAEGAALGVIRKFLAEGASGKEATAARSEFIGGYQVGLASGGGLAGELARVEALGLGVKFLDDYPGKVASVTDAQINAAARKYLSADALAAGVAGRGAK